MKRFKKDYSSLRDSVQLVSRHCWVGYSVEIIWKMRDWWNDRLYIFNIVFFIENKILIGYVLFLDFNFNFRILSQISNNLINC